jgi:hypothetical protein
MKVPAQKIREISIREKHERFLDIFFTRIAKNTAVHV